ncbi:MULTISPECIES: GNAT family N-acetyltransferase [Streptomyces]|uniref:GNAT family protein n=1 Tax=Streptomyces ramulosus TaxID=47762 RepID=A0ABW1FC65_9ACTN
MTTLSAALAPDVLIRPATVADAAALARALRRNRQHLAPFEPRRDAAHHTADGQRDRLRELVAEQDAGRALPWLLMADDGEVVGAATLTGIVGGPLRSGSLGYWIDAARVGQGLASAAVRQVCAAADAVLRLHRIEAGTLLTNAASQRVLVKNGFTAYGVAERYLHIDGAWRDHRLFQRILNDREP